MSIANILRELRDDYPAVDVTTVVFSRDFAGVGCCVIPQDRVLAVIDSMEEILTLLEKIRNLECGPLSGASDIALEALARASTS